MNLIPQPGLGQAAIFIQDANSIVDSLLIKLAFVVLIEVYPDTHRAVS
jgi:hypothetical protein